MATRSTNWSDSVSNHAPDSIPSVTLGQQADGAPKALLGLRIVRGPLAQSENESILSQYKQLAAADVASADFLRWIQDGPEGPAWHALLETADGTIVGHTSLLPFRGTYQGLSFVAAKSEYSFIREEFRTAKIRGFETTGRLKNLIYIDELFRRCRAEGWGPLVISTPAGFHRVFRSIACYPVDFPLWECLLVLRPREAARRTPNLRPWQRASLCGAGLMQTALWGTASALRRSATETETLPIDGALFQEPEKGLSFFLDQATLSWRYPAAQYQRIHTGAGPGIDVIVKQGSGTRYLRVCEWGLRGRPPAAELIAALVLDARRQGALGVRWAVYGANPASAAIVARLRSLGFLCARRVRTLLVNSADQRFLEPNAWNLTDALFSFDL